MIGKNDKRLRDDFPNPFSRLSAQNNQAILMYPVYISILASNNDDKMDETEINTAIRLAHIKTFSGEKVLTDYYKKAELVFEENLNRLNEVLPANKRSRESAILFELVNLDLIIMKMGNKAAAIFHNSLNAFKDHVSKAHNNVLLNFIFPVAIPGLTF